MEEDQLDDEIRTSMFRRLDALRMEHRDLDDAIHVLSEGLYVDQLQLRRMKMRKLRLKDNIARLESELIPDIDA